MKTFLSKPVLAACVSLFIGASLLLAESLSIEDAANQFLASFDSTVRCPIRYELGSTDTSDNYPSSGIPLGKKVYPIRVHYYWKGGAAYMWDVQLGAGAYYTGLLGKKEGFYRKDYFLFQDSFGDWKVFSSGNIITREGAKLAVQDWQANETSEPKEEAVVTEDQSIFFMNWKAKHSTDASEKSGNRPSTNVGPPAAWRTRAPGSATSIPEQTLGENSSGRINASSNPTPTATPDVRREEPATTTGSPESTIIPEPTLDQALAAFNDLQDQLGKPHISRIVYNVGTDSYIWIGPRTGKRMSMKRGEFEDEIWNAYYKKINHVQPQ